jgi:hypothetical protein
LASLSPNVATGTLNSDSRFSGTAGLNDFGQVVLNSANRAILFTPSVANRATRSFTTIPGLTATDGSASTSDWPIAINNVTVLGVSQFCAAGSCRVRYFLWTATSPHGATGTVSEIAVLGFHHHTASSTQ